MNGYVRAIDHTNETNFNFFSFFFLHLNRSSAYVSWIFHFYPSCGLWTSQSKSSGRSYKSRRISRLSRPHPQTQISTRWHQTTMKIPTGTATTINWSSTEMRRLRRLRRTMERRSTTSSKTCTRSSKNRSKEWESHHRLRQAGIISQKSRHRQGPSNPRHDSAKLNHILCVHMKRIIESIFASIWWTIIVKRSLVKA